MKNLWEERMKVPWPLSERELIVHYFLFEYFKDGLVVVLLNSVKQTNHSCCVVFSVTWYEHFSKFLFATF